MTTTILHIEDDVELGGLVKLAFETFGFRGTHLTATTVAEGEDILEQMVRDDDDLDLIISDMNLPDGTGLDVVRYVRTSIAWEHTPMLILSGDIDPRTVGRAYALGATAYINKSPPGRSLTSVVTTLYNHWISDVVLAPRPQQERFEQVLNRAIAIRGRHARIYQRVAELFADRPSESAFWLGRALCESNLTNVLAFLKRKFGEHDFSAVSIEELERMQTVTDARLTRAEQQLQSGSVSRDDAYRAIVDLISAANLDALGRSITDLFHVAPLAMTALRDFVIGAVHDICAWVTLHSHDTALHERAARLEAEARSELAALAQYKAPPV